MTLSRRLAKLEVALPPMPAFQRTSEEEEILIYEIAIAILKTERLQALHVRLAKFVARIANEIRRKAAYPLSDVYRDHIDYVEEMWVASGRTLPFVPPVLGSNHDEWFLPGLAARRIAVRRRPSVVALIGDTTTPTFNWRQVAGAAITLAGANGRGGTGI